MKIEIETDPDGVGYAGKTDEEISVLLNEPVRKQRIVEDVSPAPINRILSGLAEAPNYVSKEEVSSAKVIIADIKP